MQKRLLTNSECTFVQLGSIASGRGWIRSALSEYDQLATLASANPLFDG